MEQEQRWNDASSFMNSLGESKDEGSTLAFAPPDAGLTASGSGSLASLDNSAASPSSAGTDSSLSKQRTVKNGRARAAVFTSPADAAGLKPLKEKPSTRQVSGSSVSAAQDTPAAAESAAPPSPIPLPDEPMAPIADNELPRGDDWGYQLKWDGVRIIARVNGGGGVELFSRSMYLKTIYPEITDLLESKAAELGPCLLDGEVVWWDGVRPNFQQVLKRERTRGGTAGPARSIHFNAIMELQEPLHNRPSSLTAGHTDMIAANQTIGQQHTSALPPSGGLVYVLFDLLADNSGDLRQLPYAERHRRLAERIPSGDPRLFVADLFQDGEALWQWVQTNRWEGVVSKRLSSPYRQGKKHRDWFKKKTSLLLDVDIVGLKWRTGIIASLVMSYDGSYIGSVSLGLNDALRKVIATTFNTEQARTAPVPCPFNAMPSELKFENVQWLPLSFRCRVTGLELTSAGLIRHPKLVTFLPKEPLR